MPGEPESSAYRILQVDPSAHEDVIRAAYRALARLYHPDGQGPEDQRMTALNGAYDQIRDPQRRREYDARRALRHAVGPGPSLQPQAGGMPAQGAFGRARPVATDSRMIDFGRYAGWTLRDLAKSDPDYLRWLRRHSSGLRFRAEINRLIPPDTEPEEAGAKGRR